MTKECTHLITEAEYKDRKLQGYRCGCGVLVPVNSQFQKNKKDPLPKDHTKITLGELLSSKIEIIRRNAISILKQLQKNS